MKDIIIGFLVGTVVNHIGVEPFSIAWWIYLIGGVAVCVIMLEIWKKTKGFCK